MIETVEIKKTATLDSLDSGRQARPREGFPEPQEPAFSKEDEGETVDIEDGKVQGHRVQWQTTIPADSTAEISRVEPTVMGRVRLGSAEFMNPAKAKQKPTIHDELFKQRIQKLSDKINGLAHGSTMVFAELVDVLIACGQVDFFLCGDDARREAICARFKASIIALGDKCLAAYAAPDSEQDIHCHPKDRTLLGAPDRDRHSCHRSTFENLRCCPALWTVGGWQDVDGSPHCQRVQECPCAAVPLPFAHRTRPRAAHAAAWTGVCAWLCVAEKGRGAGCCARTMLRICSGLGTN